MFSAVQLFGLRVDRWHILLLFAVIGVLIGLFVAEYYFHKMQRRTNHVMPATIIRNSHNIAQQKLIYYALFLTMLACQYLLKINIPEVCYSIVTFAIVGGDIQQIANKILRLK